jgi:hypothetical protein
LYFGSSESPQLNTDLLSLDGCQLDTEKRAQRYAFRKGDPNMRSFWICSRNDAIGNAAVFMAALALHGGRTVLRQAKGEAGKENAKGDFAWPRSLTRRTIAGLMSSYIHG